jgi:hypothetical protein
MVFDTDRQALDEIYSMLKEQKNPSWQLKLVA